MRLFDCPVCQAKVDMARIVSPSLSAFKSLLGGDTHSITCKRCKTMTLVRMRCHWEVILRDSKSSSRLHP